MNVISESLNPIFVAYAALIVMAIVPIFFGSFHALEEIKVGMRTFLFYPFLISFFLLEGRS